jgi:WD40 repeat protein
MGESILFSTDGSAAVVVDYNNSFATILDLRDGSSAVSEISGNSFALSPDGRILAVEDYNISTVTLWDLNEQEQVGTLNGSRPLFSPDGKYISVSNFFSTAVVSVWEVSPFQPALRQAIHPTILVFSPDSRRLASYAEDGVIVRDLEDDAVYHLEMENGPAPLIYTMGFNEDGSTITALDGSGVRYIWDVATGKLQNGGDSDQPFVEGFSGLVRFSPDGNYVIYQAGETMNIWDIKQDQLQPGTLPSLRTISFSPDGNLLAGADDDGNIILFKFPELDVQGLPLDTGLKEIVNLGLVMEDTKVKYLVTQDVSGNTQIWDWPKRSEIGIAMSGNLQFVGSSTPNRAVFYIDTSGRLIKFNWDKTHEDWVEILCPLARRNFSREEWTNYFPSLNWPPARDKLTCPGYPLGS